MYLTVVRKKQDHIRNGSAIEMSRLKSTSTNVAIFFIILDVDINYLNQIISLFVSELFSFYYLNFWLNTDSDSTDSRTGLITNGLPNAVILLI